MTNEEELMTNYGHYHEWEKVATDVFVTIEE